MTDFLETLQKLHSQGASASEIRRELSAIDPERLAQINAIPRTNIREFITSTFQTHPLLSPILDVGCGYRSNRPEVVMGLSNAGRFYPDNFDYHAFDHTFLFDHNVDKENGPDFIADASLIPFADGQTATVICTELLEHVPDDTLVINEIYRVLKPGGYMILTLPGRDIPNHEKLPHQRDYRRYNPDILFPELVDIGFLIRERQTREYMGYEFNIFGVLEKTSYKM